MADWYVSSTAWTAIAQFAASHAYSVGDIVRPLTAPAFNAQYTFRCTTAGTSGAEPAWSSAASDGNTVTSGGATFTNVSGRSAYGWSAAAGNLWCMSDSSSGSARVNTGDRVFVSSDHSESQATANLSYLFTGTGAAAYGLIQIISVNRAGSVPPVAADAVSGAAITATATAGTAFFLDTGREMFWQGFTFTSGSGIQIGNTYSKTACFKNCAFVLGTNAGNRFGSNGEARFILDNCTIQFGNAGQGIALSQTSEMTWINTPSAIAGVTVPTTLFLASQTAYSNLYTLRGVDLSAITGTLLGVTGTAVTLNKVLLDSCRIASGVTRYGTPVAASASGDEIELVNCWDGTNVLNERHTAAGDITTDRSTYLTGGAQDDLGNYSIKLVSSSRSDFAVMSLDAFAFDVENTVTGSSKTATVEIVSSATLNNSDIRLLLEYMGTSGNPIASFSDSLASVLTAASALPSSANTWNSPPATPQKQLLQVTFTSQRAGRVRGLVRLGKVSTTVWVNPQVTIS